MRYEWILFDADDTLFDFKRSARLAFERTLEHIDMPNEARHWEAYELINRQVWAAFERQEITAETLRRLRFERFLRQAGHPADPVTVNRFYLEQLAGNHFLTEGATELVQYLTAKGRQLGLITNGLREVQRPRISRSALAGRFPVVVVSDEIGVAKPHSGFFDYVHRAMGTPEPDRVLVVGDSLHSDIQGGNAFGHHTCWYNPDRKANDTPYRPTYEIRALADLKNHLFHQDETN
jgi:2-haloacid dehalogenase